jgi:hypothetical protein
MNSFRRQSARAQLQASLRVAISLFGSELRELGGDSVSGGDVIEADSTSIVYRAMRRTAFICRPTDPSRLEVVVWRDHSYGQRSFEPGRDSLLLFAENDPLLEQDNAWLRALIVSRGGGRLCPAGAAGVRLGLAGVSTSELAGVERGAPVRGFQVTRLLLYQDREATSWLGLKEWAWGRGWSITQPVLGPLTATGLRLEYSDRGGGATANPGAVAMVAVTVEARSDRRLPRTGYLTDSLATFVALRNLAHR